MANGSKAGKAGKPSKEAKAAAKAARKQASKERRSQLWQAFQMQRKEDKALLPLMIGAIVGITVIAFLIGLIIGIEWFLLPFGLLLGVLAAFIIFGRRVQKSVYKKADGQAGAAAWALDNLRGSWRVTNAIAGTTQLDAVHRVIGKPGVILVAEGAPQRVKSLLAQERRRLHASSVTPRSTTSSSATETIRFRCRVCRSTWRSFPTTSTASEWTPSNRACRRWERRADRRCRRARFPAERK
jgi:F0F1-type ATP synthase assembly protein I